MAIVKHRGDTETLCGYFEHDSTTGKTNLADQLRENPVLSQNRCSAKHVQSSRLQNVLQKSDGPLGTWEITWSAVGSGV